MRKILYILLIMHLSLFFTTLSFAKDYSYEIVDSYTYHHFEFSEEEKRDIAKGPYKAKQYIDWILEEIGIKEITSRAVLEFKLTSLARLAEREGKEALKVEFRSFEDESGNLTLELYDSGIDTWKEL